MEDLGGCVENELQKDLCGFMPTLGTGTRGECGY